MQMFYFPACSLFIIVLIIICFYSKGRFRSEETTLYNKLILVNFFETIFSIIILSIGYNFGVNYFVYLFNRLDFICCLLWIWLFFSYITYVSITSRSGKIDTYKKIIKIGRIINAIALIFILVLPLNVYHEGDVAYAYGVSTEVLYSVVVLHLIGIFVCLMYNRKNLNNRKYIPLYALIFLILILMIIRKINPGILVISVFLSYIDLIMYFTIENPDMKLLEELHKSKEISDSANEEKALFIYNLTQDIRSISSAIDDDADYILDSKNWNETYDCARNIKFNSAKFTTMTNEILDVSKMDLSNIKTYNSKYNIKNVLKRVINVYSDICKNKELQFRTNIDHNIPEELYGDGIGLKEVLNTILSNSCKYTDKGFIEFSVNTIIKNDICRLIFTIEDSGIGIKSEDINRIKVNNKSLSKVNKLLTLMNGTMLISSDYGIGTKVKIILDQKIENVENKELTKYDKVLDNINVLAVDDSDAGLKIIDKLLNNTNIKLDKAMTGKECLDMIKVNKYDLILLDEELSQITANELIVKIKEIRNFETPVVLLTKDNSYEYNEEYIKNGFIGYILKPLKKEIFISKINEYVKKDNNV